MLSEASCKAVIARVEPLSPADDAGFEPGCAITHVDGRPLRDVIDWRWLSDGDEMTVGYIDLQGDEGEVDLWREPGQAWGFEFADLVFDDIKQCRNACTFCFIRQLPEGTRDSLSVRDDDFRLSFLTGTFVTLTNLTPDDEARIVEQNLSPLRFSLHAVTPELRRRIIGAHAQAGIDALERLLAAGIEFHVQIVLMPGVNDGDELSRTLAWCYERPGLLNVGIVPVGYTKHQSAFLESFESRDAARAVIETVEPFQRRALADGRGDAWVFPADEFYRNAWRESLLDHVPPSDWYGEFELFEDGIGMLRSFIDDWEGAARTQADLAAALRASGRSVALVCGCAQREMLDPLFARSPLAGWLRPLYVENDYFGGNVDVTGLLCGCDIARALQREAAAEAAPAAAFITRVVFNDDGVTLDDMRVEEIEETAGLPVRVVSCKPSEYLLTMAEWCASARSA